MLPVVLSDSPSVGQADRRGLQLKKPQRSDRVTGNLCRRMPCLHLSSATRPVDLSGANHRASRRSKLHHDRDSSLPVRNQIHVRT
jgi:hypothetical protein